MIEMALCLVLLALLGTLMGYKGSALINHYRSRASELKLKNELRLARSLSLSYHADIVVKGEYDGRYFCITKEADDPKVYLAQFCKKPVQLFFAKEQRPDPFTITYYSNGHSESQ